MPTDLRVKQDFRDFVVVDRFGSELPFSKGLLATSILATGAETPRAYEVAHHVQDYLHDRRLQRISAEELTNLTADTIARLQSEDVAERYLLWRRARRIGRPIIISLLGSSGVGKSTLATRLALRLGINRVITTDSIREVLRTVVPASVLPELHVSSYEAIADDLEELHSSTYHRQARAVASASAAVAKRCVNETKNALFEGVHLLPGSLAGHLGDMDENPIVVEFLLSLGDPELHNNRLVHRQVSEPGRNGARHLASFEVIRELQQTMQEAARKAGIPEFDVGSDEDLTQRIVREIVRQALE
ncbi:MAG: hypothetical protein KJO76_10345 [Gammaproteobacteria bacterium]|nr:hypothetical protein [Gammaproteobacteria bacterium]MBT8443746.1 hypothetical protein [Gammaproteobacteria bacterium]